MNDIRIKARDKTSTESTGGTLALSQAADVTMDLINPSRRNLLRVALASGGILIAGSLMSKVSKLNSFALDDQASGLLGSMFPSKNSGPTRKQNADDLSSFFENFRIVKNDKEYILYNKEGDNILIIDRDA